MKSISSKQAGIQLLQRAIERELRWKLVASVILFIIGGLISYTCFEQSMILTIASLLGLVLGGRFMHYLVCHQRAEQLPIMQLLYENPTQIVWVYAVVTQQMPFGLGFSKSGVLYFKLLDGNDFSVSAPVPHLAKITKTLNTILPHAAFGYSKTRAQLYEISPDLVTNEEV